MPLDPLPLLLLFLGHPATWAVAAVPLAFAFGFWVRWQLRSVGVMELEDRIRWSQALSAFATLLAGSLLEALVAHAFGLSAAASWLGAAFLQGLSVVPALLLLAGASWYSTHRRGADKELAPSIVTELRAVQLGSGLLAAMSVVEAPMVPLLAVLVLVGAFWWYRTTPDAAEKVRNWQNDWSAGTRLRKQLDADAIVELDGESVSVIGKAGLLETDVLTDEGMRTVANRRLAEAAAARRVRG